MRVLQEIASSREHKQTHTNTHTHAEKPINPTALKFVNTIIDRKQRASACGNINNSSFGHNNCTVCGGSGYVRPRCAPSHTHETKTQHVIASIEQTGVLSYRFLSLSLVLSFSEPQRARSIHYAAGCNRLRHSHTHIVIRNAHTHTHSNTQATHRPTHNSA